MKKNNFLFNVINVVVLMWLTSCASPRHQSYEDEITTFRQELNASFRDSAHTPLRGRHLKEFTELPFFPVNKKYAVQAHLKRTPEALPFEIPTSSGQNKKFRSFGIATFLLDGKEYQLTLYESLKPDGTVRDATSLFLPFRDLTNDEETYGGGRYLDIKKPTGEKVMIDFNKAYHPYCAYNAFDYSCPLVPTENRLIIAIPAGVKYEKKYY